MLRRLTRAIAAAVVMLAAGRATAQPSVTDLQAKVDAIFTRQPDTVTTAAQPQK
jgi:hypothetical protein